MGIVALLLAPGCRRVAERPADPVLDRVVEASPSSESASPGAIPCEALERWAGGIVVIQEDHAAHHTRVALRLERERSGAKETWSLVGVRVRTHPKAVPWLGRIEEEIHGWVLELEHTASPPVLTLRTPTSPEMTLYRDAILEALGLVALSERGCASQGAAELTLLPGGGAEERTLRAEGAEVRGTFPWRLSGAEGVLRASGVRAGLARAVRFEPGDGRSARGD